MGTIIKYLAILIGIAIAIGFYYRTEDELLGDQIIGLSVLASVFILMPIFLYHRWKGKKLKDYTLSEENLRKMRDRNKD